MEATKPALRDQRGETAMSTTTVEAIYEQGVLRLEHPIALAEGTRVRVVVIPEPSRAETPGEPGSRKRTPAEIIAEIAAMAMESDDEPTDVARNHDKYLYGWDKDE
jgi:predicted DNA-binding antitoxin AbrB/MazE fold protein